eukprot:1196389-Prorocentrum_minimum.AAC.1
MSGRLAELSSRCAELEAELLTSKEKVQTQAAAAEASDKRVFYTRLKGRLYRPKSSVRCNMSFEPGMRLSLGLGAAIKPLLSHSVTGEFNFATKYLRPPAKPRSRHQKKPSTMSRDSR